MENVWREFYKLILGPLNTKEDALHPTGCTLFTCYHEHDARIKSDAETMQLWDAFAVRHYVAPQVSGSIEAALKYA